MLAAGVPRTSPPASGKRTSAGDGDSSRRVPRKSTTNTTRARTPPSPRRSLGEGGLAPISNRSRQSVSPAGGDGIHEDKDFMQVLAKQRDAVARDGVDTYVSKRVASGRAATSTGGSPVGGSSQSRMTSVTDGTYDSIIAPRSQRSVGNLSARRAQSKNNAPVEEITLTRPKVTGGGSNSSLDLYDSNIDDLGDLDDILSSGPHSARKSPRKNGGMSLREDDDMTIVATRMLEGAFAPSPRQPLTKSSHQTPVSAKPVAWSPRPTDNSLSTFPDSANTWGTLASTAPSPMVSAKRPHGSGSSPQPTHLPSITSSRIIPQAVVPTASSSRKQPSPRPSMMGAGVSSSHPAPPSSRHAQPTTSNHASLHEKPPQSEKPPLSGRKNIATHSPAKVNAKQDLNDITSSSPDKNTVFNDTAAPRKDKLQPKAPSDGKARDASIVDGSPHATPRKHSSRVASVAKSDDKMPVVSGKKKPIPEIIPEETPPPTKPTKSTTGARTSTTTATSKVPRKSIVPTTSPSTTKAGPATAGGKAPAGARKSIIGAVADAKPRRQSISDVATKIILEKRGSKVEQGARGKSMSGPSGGSGAMLADLLWGDSLYASEPIPTPITADTDAHPSAVSSTSIYPIPYLRRIEEIRTRVRVSNEQGKFTDDELKQVQGWEVIGDDLKEALARCIEELISKELVLRESSSGSSSSGAKHKVSLWDAVGKKPFRVNRPPGTVPSPSATAAKGKTTKPSASSSSTVGPADSLVGKIDDDYATSGIDVRLLRLSEKAIKMEAAEIAAIISAQGPSPYYRKDPLLVPTKSVQEDDDKFGTIFRSLVTFDSAHLSQSLSRSLTARRASVASNVLHSEEEAMEYFKDQFYELTVVGDGKKGNLRLVKAILQATLLGMVVAGATTVSLRECCEERGVVASSISDGSMEFIPELMLQYVLEGFKANGEDEEDFSLDMYDVFTSAMFQQQYRIPLVEILMDVLIIPPPRSSSAKQTPSNSAPPTLESQNRLFKELMKIKGELKETWQEFFHDVCDAKKAIPRELRGRRVHLVRKMMGLPDVEVVAGASNNLVSSPSGLEKSVVLSAAQQWLNKWSPSSTSSVMALRAILQGNTATPDVGPTTGKPLISATARFWKYLLPSSNTATVNTSPVFVYGPWDLALWKTHGDGYDVISRAARDNDIDLLPALQEGLERLPPSWAVDMLLPKASQKTIRLSGTVASEEEVAEEEEDVDAESRWPLELYVGIEYDDDAIEDIRNDLATAESPSIPPASLASYYRAIYQPPTTSPLPLVGPYVAPSRKGPSAKDARIATLFDQLLLRRGRDDMTPLFTAALGNSASAVSWILDMLDVLPNHTTFTNKTSTDRGASTRWMAVAMVQLPCQIEGLGTSLDMVSSLNKDEEVIVALEEFASI